MKYDPKKLKIKEDIDRLLPVWKKEFLDNTENIADAPMYDTGKNLDIYKKWKLIPVKIMDDWNYEYTQRYPKFAEFVKSLGHNCRGAGYSILEPGGHVLPHIDTEEDQDKYIIVHAPLIVPQGDVGFEEAGDKGQWVEGDTFILDVESKHSIWNNTNMPRVVILLELSKEKFLSQ